jgi:ribose transport system permease protein
MNPSTEDSSRSITGLFQNLPIDSKWMQRFKTLAPLWTLLALFIFFGLTAPNFLGTRNLENILRQISTLAIFATGMTFVLLLAEIDLSIAAIAALSAMISAYLFHNLELQEPWPMLAALGAATGLGFINGIASARFRIPSFMTTLAMSLIAAGLTTYLSKGRVITDVSPVAEYLGSGRIGGQTGFPVIVIVAVLSLAIGYFVLRYTRFGRHVYMTGASKTAARLAGVNTDRILVIVMTICGFTAGMAGIISMGRLASAQPDATESFLIDTIGAVVLGGTSLMGGRGGMLQTVIGLLIYGTLRNGLDNIPSIDIYLKEFITGVVLLVALIVNTVFAGSSERDKTV